MERKWYRADFECICDNGEVFNPDSEYFIADNDDAAKSYAMLLASQGVDYVDIGHRDAYLVSVYQVDPENEWYEIKTVFY